MRCKANNCPLPVNSITDRHDDGSPKWGVCVYHKNAPGDQWVDTTTRINQVLPALKILFAIDKLDITHRPKPGEKVEAWVNRLKITTERYIYDREQVGDVIERTEQLKAAIYEN